MKGTIHLGHQLHRQMNTTAISGQQNHNDENGSLQYLHRLKGKMAVRHLRNKLASKRNYEDDMELARRRESLKINRYVMSCDKSSFKTQQQLKNCGKQRHGKMLPQLSLDISLEKRIGTEPSVNSRNTKILDLIIDILKDDSKQTKPAQPDIHSTDHLAVTPMNLPRGKLYRFNTEPSVEYIQPVPSKRPQKHRGPVVIQNEIVKFSSNMNVIRKNMFSQNRSRFNSKNRHEIRSSGNSRMNEQLQHFKSPEGSTSNIELMTFYPKGPKQSFTCDAIENEFMDVDNIHITHTRTKH